MNAETEPVTLRRWPLIAMQALLAAGLAMAIYLVWLKLRLEWDSSYKAVCDLSPTFNCGQVQTDASSMLFGLPVGLYAIPTYLVMALLAWTGLRGKEGSRSAVAYVAGIGFLTVIHSAYLAYVSTFVIGAYCLFCIGMYAVNLGATVLAIVSLGQGVGGAVSLAATSLGRRQGPLVAATVVLLVTGGASLAWYQSAADSMASDTIAQGAAEMFPELADNDSAKPEGQAGAADGASPQADGAKPAGKKPTAKLTDNGWSYYEIPVEDHNPVLGPADAAVTVTVIKDFECSFCKYVTYQTKTLKAKYKDSVRFVFKHYPMNGECNYRMGSSRMHEGACRAAYASVCAQEQGKFWELHDVLYQNQKKFSDAELRGYVEKLGLDLASYDACYASDRPKETIKKDIRLASKMRVNGTPRLYINNRLVTGSVAKDVLDYYVQLAQKYPVPPDQAAATKATAKTPTTVKVSKGSGPFWIDAFEASIGGDGRAVSLAGVRPAIASWFESKAACEAAGKRLCTEEEWVSACIGEPALDANGNGHFTDGEVTGRLYPYGPFYDKGACRDSEDKYTGTAAATGSMAGCRTAEGVYDMSGNLYEWVGTTPDEASMMGGDWRTATSGTCRRRAATYGPGIKNDTVGFRCCSDSAAPAVAAAKPEDLRDTSIGDIVGKGVPKDLVLDFLGGGKLSPRSFRGKVTYLTFFASWCGNCRKQMPAIKEWHEDWGKKGFQVVAINVDRKEAAATRYLKELEANFPIALDPAARTMTDFGINAMPTSFIVDRKGRITKRVVGYKDKEIAQTKKAIADLL